MGAGNKLIGGGKWIGRGLTVLSGVNVILHWHGVYKDYQAYKESQRIPIELSLPEPKFKFNTRTELGVGGLLQWAGEARCEPNDVLVFSFHNDFGSGNDFELKEGFHSFTGTFQFNAQQQINDLPYPSNQRLALGEIDYAWPDGRMISNGQDAGVLTPQLAPPTRIVYRYVESGNPNNVGPWQSMADTYSRYVFRFSDNNIIDIYSWMGSLSLAKATMRANGFNAIEFAAGYYSNFLNRVVFTPQYGIK